MPANRFYAEEIFEEGKSIRLSPEESHHLIRVMRMKEKETVQLINGKGCLALATVCKIEKQMVILTILDLTLTEPKLPPLTLIQALPKLSHLELIIQKGTELGVTSFYLFPSERSEKKELSQNQRKRLEQICIGAMKQCGRLDLPKIYTVSHLKNLDLPKGHAYFGDPIASQSLPKGNSPYNLFIGPEKGLTDQEHHILKTSFHAEGVCLHPYTLRAETAAIVAITLAFQRL